MTFDDEPPTGQGLPILPGHNSTGRLERILRAGRVCSHRRNGTSRFC